MTIGPIELVVLGFEGNNFKGEIASAIQEAINSGAVRVIDLVAVRKDRDGHVMIQEVEDLGEMLTADLTNISGELRDILTEDEANTIAEALPPNTAALVALFEHTWATRISAAVRNAGGQLLASQRISPRLVEQVRVQLDEVMAAEPVKHY